MFHKTARLDHLVSQVFVSDDNTVVYFNIRGGKNIDKITIDDTTVAIENNIKNVRPLTLPLHHFKPKTNSNEFVFVFFDNYTQTHAATVCGKFVARNLTCNA